MSYWLVKSEPFKYSWDQFATDKRTRWDGIRNYGARNNLRSMKKDDLVLFYHSNEGKEIVGIAKVIRTAYQDPTTEDKAWLAVDLKPVRKLKKPVSLNQVKEDKRLASMELIRLSRLSVSAVSSDEWEILLEISS